MPRGGALRSSEVSGKDSSQPPDVFNQKLGPQAAAMIRSPWSSPRKTELLGQLPLAVS